MIPGVGNKIKDLDVNEDSFKGIEAMINSMTPGERNNPDLIDGKPPQAHSQRLRQRHQRGKRLYETIRANAGYDERHE